MITLSHITIRYSGRSLFEDITCTIGPKDRVGLTGKNGAGKSTMLKLIAREHSSDEGEVITPNGFTIGYLPQDGIYSKGKTVYNEVATTVFAKMIALDERIHAISDELASRTDYESDAYSDLLHELTDANEEFTREGGATMRGAIEQILGGLGFTHEDMDRLTDEFSGGWQMRIELAKILLRKPNCILLDEPTNHLDIESVQWLEQFLKNYDGSVVLVSHDRAFLDAVTNRTIEITNATTEDYNVSYSQYVIQRVERRQLLQSAYDNQQKEIAQQERFIERFRSKASLATRVQSRIKQLDKVERIELDDEDTSSIKFQFQPAPRSGRTSVEVIGLKKSYDDKPVLKGVDLALERGDRVAFVGKNGEGKSTLSRIIAGKEVYQDGLLTIGHNVQIGYYDQHQSDLMNGDMTVFQIIDDEATGEMRTKVRSLLGAFLFSGDAVNKKVKVLSGGERSRLAMAKLLLQPSNLLILDEPTNHLDMRSKDVLKQALMDFEGTLIVVSHDREFLQGLTTKVVEFRGGSLKEYDGDIYDYLRARNIESLNELERKKVANQKTNEEQRNNAQKAREQQQQQNKDREKEVRKIKKSIEECEQTITKLEKEIAQLDERMMQSDFYQQPDYNSTVERYNKAKAELETVMTQWEQFQTALAE